MQREAGPWEGAGGDAPRGVLRRAERVCSWVRGVGRGGLQQAGRWGSRRPFGMCASPLYNTRKCSEQSSYFSHMDFFFNE